MPIFSKSMLLSDEIKSEEGTIFLFFNTNSRDINIFHYLLLIINQLHILSTL